MRHEPLNLPSNKVLRRFTPEETKAWLATLEKRVSSAHAVLYTDNGNVLIVRNSYLKQWSLPGGVIDPGETPRAAAVREVDEEIGVRLTEFDLEFCLVVDCISSVNHRYQFIFQARVDEEVLQNISLDLDEIAEWEVTTRQAVLDNPDKYFQSVVQWADGIRGYIEEIFDTVNSPHD